MPETSFFLCSHRVWFTCTAHNVSFASTNLQRAYSRNTFSPPLGSSNPTGWAPAVPCTPFIGHMGQYVLTILTLGKIPHNSVNPSSRHDLASHNTSPHIPPLVSRTRPLVQQRAVPPHPGPIPHFSRALLSAHQGHPSLKAICPNPSSLQQRPGKSQKLGHLPSSPPHPLELRKGPGHTALHQRRAHAPATENKCVCVCAGGATAE